MSSLSTPLSTPLLDRLLADGVIGPAHRETAQTRLQAAGASTEPYANLGEALFWLHAQEILSDADIGAIGELAESQAAFPTNATRAQALAEFDLVLDGEVNAILTGRRRAFWRDVFPGPGWIWPVIGVAVVAAAVWYGLPPAQPPACTDATVAKHIRVNLFMDTIKWKSAHPLEAAQTPSPNMLMADFKDVRELGYIEAERARACEATLQSGQDTQSMTYVIRLDESGNTQLSTGDARLTRARFALVKDGKLPELGLPVGQANLQQALSAGTLAVETRAGLRGPRSAARVEREGERPDTVVQVLPLGNCEAGRRGTYRCPVMVQYRDRLLSAIGRSALQVLQGEFDFVREGEGAGGQWRVTDSFPQQYLDATVRARVSEMAGSEAAERLEQIQKNRSPR